MRSLCVALLLVFLAQAVLSDGICDNVGQYSDSELKELLAAIESKTFESDKLAVLGDALSKSPNGFTGNQTAQILHQFKFSSDQEEALDLMGDYVLSFSCADVVSVLNQFSFSSAKLEVLEVVIELVIRDDLKANNQTIIDLFNFSSDKEAAKKIIDASKGRSCVWGDVSEAEVVFVIDTSGSMTTTFTINGKRYTRLQYVKKELDEVIRYQLQGYQSFNLISFSTGVSVWAPGLQHVNSTSIDSAVSFVAKLSATGGTNALAALERAFKETSVQAIYFLSDGEPNPGQAAKILAAIPGWEKNAGRNIMVHATAFAAPAQAQSFMKQVAALTGGVYRAISSS